MNRDAGDALNQALALRSEPARLSALRVWALPADLLVLFEVVGGKSETIERCAALSGASRAVLIEAATLYIQQVLFDDGSDHYRVLGARRGDSIEKIHEHHRWLMRWLHPDRAGARWETVYFDRVNVAWNTLRLAERRQDYDRSLDAVQARARERAQGPLSRTMAVNDVREPWLSGRTLRRLPLYVGTTLGVLVVVGLVVGFPGGGGRLHREPNAGPAQPEVSVSRDDQRFSSGDVQTSEASPPATDRRARVDASNETTPPVEPIAPHEAAAVALGSVDRSPQADVARSAIGRISAPPRQPPPKPEDESRADSPTHGALPSVPAGVVPTIRRPAGTYADTQGRRAADRLAGLRGADAAVATRPQHDVSVAGSDRAGKPAIVPVAGTHALLQAPTGVGASRHGNSHDVASSSRTEPTERASESSYSVSASPAQKVIDPASTAQPAMPSPAVAEAVSRSLVSAYATGDISRMMRLFAPDAVENRGGIDAIEADYRTLFRDSVWRELDLSGVNWVIHADRIVGSGAYVAHVRARGDKNAKSFTGWIRIEAVLLGGEWKIETLLHGDRR